MIEPINEGHLARLGGAWRGRRGTLVLIVALCLAGCRRGGDRESTRAAGGAAAAATPLIASVTPSARPRDATTGARSSTQAPTPDTKISLAARQRYQTSLARGRAATLAKNWPAAEQAFAEALVAMPEDARAHGERGYARLLAGDIPAADADFDKAFGASTDRKLSAQLWFNRGLARERMNDAELARQYFAYSLEINPTLAARQKLNGKTACPARAQRISGEDFPSWLAAWNALSRKNADGYPDGEPQPRDDLAVRARYGAEECGSFCVGFASSDRHLHGFFPLPGGGVRVFRELYAQTGGRCEGAANVARHGDVWDITTLAWVVGLNCDGASCTEVCEGPGEWRSASLVLEPREHSFALVVERAGVGDEPEPRVSATTDGARVDGPGCPDPFLFTAVTH